MPGTSISAWLSEQEKQRRPAVFIAEWLVLFALAGAIWTGILARWLMARPSGPLVIAVASFYASAIVYTRLFNVTRCLKCRSPLPLLRRETDRQHVRDMERCVEVESGGEEWGVHFLTLYRRSYSVDKVHYECRRCHAVWQAMEESATSDYERVRRIDLGPRD